MPALVVSRSSFTIAAVMFAMAFPFKGSRIEGARRSWNAGLDHSFKRRCMLRHRKAYAAAASIIERA
jgi:hypothetical protein